MFNATRRYLFLILSGGAFLVFLTPAFAASTTLVPYGATWKYLDDGSNQNTAWQEASFSDSAWKSGAAELGYGDGDEKTVIGYGPDANNKYITYYFRRTFNVSDRSAFGSLTLKFKRDDGGIVYINGTEVFRNNMPTGSVTYTTRASSSSGTTVTATLDNSSLQNGANLITVEVHQSSPRSSDVSFNLSLIANSTSSSSVCITRGPYVQLSRPRAMTIRWRTNVATNSRVHYSTSPTSQNLTVDNTNSTTEHSVTVEGLKSNTKYYYVVGTTTAALSPRNLFYTSPDDGHPLSTRIWVVGDSGVNASTAKSVRNAFDSYTGTRYTNLFLLLGDSAYNAGSDSEYQTKFFDVFGSRLAKTSAFAVLGEHDTGGSSNPSSSIPYFSIFDLPKNAEAGGYASGTEKYYSFNYGTIHFVALDSIASNRSSSGSMLTWLKQDLSRNKRPWLIALWHHSPYSKGNHDSDVETQMSQMRQNANKILEDYGVDLVLGAHSNTYERSYFIDGHYGTSSTFTSSMLKDGGNGRSNLTGEYKKAAASVHSGTVYTVLGSSSSTGTGPLNHPAMYTSQSSPGSLVIDLNCTKMDVKFLRDTGSIADYFTIRKQNITPTVTITAPSTGANFSAGSNITITAGANDPDSIIRKVRFFQNGNSIGTDSSKPYSIVWKNVKAGSYSLTAIVEDNLCASSTSKAINISVK